MSESVVSNAERPNVIWVVMDAVRADHTSMDGYCRDTTPNLKAIASSDDGRWFKNCIAPAHWTGSSTASYLTGTYPMTHRVRKGRQLSSDLQTIPELLSDIGYRTMGLSKNPWFGEVLGLTRGFDRYELITMENLVKNRHFKTLGKYLLNLNTHADGLARDRRKHSTAYIMTEVAKQWLRSMSSEESFLYIHYNEPHKAYYPPKPYFDEYTDDTSLSRSELEDLGLRSAASEGFSKAEIRGLEALYDGELAYTDDCFADLFEFIQTASLGETVVVVTSDHGNPFRPFHGAGIPKEGYFGEDLIRVPLVTHGFDIDDTRTNQLVQPMDVLQALLSEVGADVSQFGAVDPRTRSREFTVTQRGLGTDGLFATCLRTSDYKYVKQQGEAELFENGVESTDIANEHPDIVDNLDSFLNEWLRSQSRGSQGTASEISKEIEDRLSELGYKI